ERVEELAVLEHDPTQVLAPAVAEEVGADARLDREPDLEGVGQAGVLEHLLVEADGRLDNALQGAPGGAPAHVPRHAPPGVPPRRVHRLHGAREAELLDREADRDEDAVHLLLRDTQDLAPAVGEAGDQSLLLQLAERLADRSPADLEALGELLLEKPRPGR